MRRIGVVIGSEADDPDVQARVITELRAGTLAV
jgi:hypothetical protein